MEERTENSGSVSMPTLETLEAWLRVEIQTRMQQILEEEVAQALGRSRYERRSPVDAPAGYRNGHGKSRQLALSCGTVRVRRPRVRGLEKRFESRLLPLFARRTKEVGQLLPELYLHGLAQGDFELALRGLLGNAAPLSPSSIGRLRGQWVADWRTWSGRRLDDRELVYAWADGLYVKAGLEKDKAALLVIIGALRDGTKEVLAVVPGYRESTESWLEVLRDLGDRGLAPPLLLVADGHLGIWSAVEQLWPETKQQRCWNHKLTNVLDRLPRRVQAEALPLLRAVPAADSVAAAETARRRFLERFGRDFPDAVDTLNRDWDRMLTFHQFPKEHWQHLRTTNIVESPFASVRLRTDAAKRFKKVANATALIWRLLMVAEKRFRRLTAAHLLAAVYAGQKYENGIAVIAEGKRAA